MIMKKIIKPAYEDPDNSVDLFDADRLNEWGEMYCVAPSILPVQVEQAWDQYAEYRAEELASQGK